MKNKIKDMLKKIIALAVVFSFSLVYVSFAQTDTATPAPITPDTSASTPVPTPDLTQTLVSTPDTAATSTDTATPAATLDATATSTDTATPAPPSTPDPSTPVVQDTVNTQVTVSGTTLESTTDPQSASSTVLDTSIIPVTSATSTLTSTATLTATSTDSTTTDGASLSVSGSTASSTPLLDSTTTATTDVVAQSIDTTTPPPTDPTIPSTPQALPDALPATVPIAELAPKPAYAFALTGTTIPSKIQFKDTDGKVVQEQSVTTTLTPTVDNTTGEVTVSGACTNVYFVVLLFKNKTDYTDDPSSYLVNRAYPCVNGAYSYSIADLPYNLTDGTYYLMVGQEGKTGTWSPITELSEITINRNQQQ